VSLQQQRSKLDQLGKLQGAAFEREYIRETTRTNTEDVNGLQKELPATSDQDVRSFVSEVLPV